MLKCNGLLQSPEEWEIRIQILGRKISELVKYYVEIKNYRGLDIGCQDASVTKIIANHTLLNWWGLDPFLGKEIIPSMGINLLLGWAHQIPFSNAHFDCAVLANVYEHISPDKRTASLSEIQRVLRDGGILIGQLPNPYFPIESHSRLPFMGWLPYRIQKLYWNLAPVPWEHDFYVVGMSDLKRRAESLGLLPLMIEGFNYPIEVIPSSIRWAARLSKPVTQIFPWSWLFVFRKV